MKDFLIGALGGYSKAQEAENKSLLDNEISRRKQLSEFWKSQVEDPNVRPEARDVAMQKYHTILQTPYEKKLPKGIEALDDFLKVTPQLGQSVQRPPTESLSGVPSPYGSALPNVVEPIAPPRLTQEDINQWAPSPPRFTMDEQQGMARQAMREKADYAVDMAGRTAAAEQKAKRDYAIPEPPKPFSAAAGSMAFFPDGQGGYVQVPIPGRTDNLTEGEMRRTTAYGLFAERNKLDPSKLTFQQKAQAEKELAEMMDINGQPLYPVVQGNNVVWKPREQASGQSAPRTLYGAEGMPSTGGQAGLSTTPPPVVPESTQTQLAGWKVAHDSFNNLIPQLKANAKSLGQLAGRVTMGKVELGGYGATPAQIRMMISMKQQIIQAFADGGKNLTGVEKEIFTDLNPKGTETLQQAVIKAEMGRDLAKARYEARVGVMAPRQQGQVPAITGQEGQMTGPPEPPPPGPAPGPNMVYMRLTRPDGTSDEGWIPSANEKTALGRGYRKIQ